MQVTRDDLITAFREAKIVKAPENLRSDIKLTDQGIDSLGMYSVFLALQDKYAIEFPDSDVDRLTTIDELVTYLNHRLA